MSGTGPFSEREREVTELLMQGKSNKQIALALGLSASTVEYHLKNVYKKLGVNSRTEAVLRLGKSMGGNGTGELGKSTVELNDKATDNGLQPVSTWRMPMGRSFMMIGAGLFAIACIVVFVLVNSPFQSMAIAPTNVSSSLPDLVISSVYVSMVDTNGRCLPYYGINVTVYNRGDAPAVDVTLTDINTGQEVQVGTLYPLQGTSTSFVAKAVSESHTVVADLHNTILESNEANNSGSFSEATATPVASCPTLQSGYEALTPVPFTTHTVVSTSLLPSLPDLIIEFTYLEMEGRQGPCAKAYAPYEIRVKVKNIGLTDSGPFAVDLNDSRQSVDGGLAASHSVELHFAGTTASGQYQVRADSLDQVDERDENNNVLTYFAPTPTLPLLCTATPVNQTPEHVDLQAERLPTLRDRANVFTVGYLSSEEQGKIYAAVIRRLAGYDDGFGGSLAKPILYILTTTNDFAGDMDLPMSAPQSISLYTQLAIEDNTSDLTSEIKWVDDHDEVKLDPQHSNVIDGIIVTLGNTLIGDDGRLYVGGCTYYTYAAGQGQTYVFEMQAGQWVLVGITGIWLS